MTDREEDVRALLDQAFRWGELDFAERGVSALEAHRRPECLYSKSWARVLWKATNSPLGSAYVGRLVSAGIPANATDIELDPLCEGCTGVQYGYGALHYATSNRDGRTHSHGWDVVEDFSVRVDIVRELIDASADPDLVSAGGLWSGGGPIGSARIGGATPAMFVAKWHDEQAAIDTLDVLRSAGADLDTRCLSSAVDWVSSGHVWTGDTAFTIAQRVENHDVADWLVAAGVTPWDRPAELQIASSSDPGEINDLLGSKVVGHDHIWTQLYQREHPDMFAAHIEAGLDPTAAIWGAKQIPLMATLLGAMARTRAPAGHFQLALDAGADVNASDAAGRAALHELAAHLIGPPGHTDDRAQVIPLILAAGARVDARDQWGNTPLMRTMFEGRASPEVTDILLNAGADPNAENVFEMRIVAHAVQAGATVGVLEALLSEGASLNAPVKGLPLWAFVLSENPTQWNQRVSAVVALMSVIVHHPTLIIDLGAPGVDSALNKAESNEYMKPFVDTIRERANG